MRFKLLLHIRRTLKLLSKRLNNNQLIYLLAFIVGLGSGLAAILLKHTIILVKNILTSWFNAGIDSLLYLAYPGIGILITILFVRYFVKDDLSHGITKVLYAISRKKSKLKAHNMYSPIIASSFTIGFGGPVGAVAPIVLTCSAIGSNIGQFLKLDYKKITLLLGCGAAGAIAGIFKAPLAGIVFTLEILMLDLTLASIIPLLISSVTATVLSYFFLGHDVAFANTAQDFAIKNVPYYMLLGVFCGFAALYFIRATLFVEAKFSKINSPWRKWFVGSVIIGVLVFFIPSLYGEGYEIFSALFSADSRAVFENSLFYGMHGEVWLIMAYLFLILVFKVFAMSITNASGGVGGTFGPTLFMGGISGFFVARLINISGIHQVPEVNFTFVGMAGLMAAVMHAPLTAIFLIAEITGGYKLFMPLIITSVIAFITVRIFEPHSLYSKRLAMAGELITHNKDKAALTLLDIKTLIESDFKSVLPNDSLRVLVKVISKSKRNLFPVVNAEGEIEGVVLLDDIRQIIFQPELYDTYFVYQLMIAPPAIAAIDESMEGILEKFEKTNAWNIPVVDKKGLYLGFLSKSKILSAYRDLLKEFSDE